MLCWMHGRLLLLWVYGYVSLECEVGQRMEILGRDNALGRGGLIRYDGMRSIRR
jgi:hypothetical protein